MLGVWCLHCERVTEVKDRPVMLCPHCEAEDYDLWTIIGDFVEGETVEHLSDRHVELLDLAK